MPIGSVQYIDQATLDEFRQFYHTYYIPNNAVLSLAGDFDPEDAKQQIEQYFGPIPRGPEPPRPKVEFYQPVGQTGTTGKTVEIVRQNTPLPASLHAWLAPKENDPDARALELLTDILAGGRSSRLYRRMVDGEQVAIQATAFPYFLEDGGMVGIFAVGLRGVALERLDTLMDEEVAKVRKDGVTEEEFQKARNQKESEVASSYATNLARARGLADFHVFYGSTDALNHELDLYLQVTRRGSPARGQQVSRRGPAGHPPLPGARCREVGEGPTPPP